MDDVSTLQYLRDIVKDNSEEMKITKWNPKTGVFAIDLYGNEYIPIVSGLSHMKGCRFDQILLFDNCLQLINKKHHKTVSMLVHNMTHQVPEEFEFIFYEYW